MSAAVMFRQSTAPRSTSLRSGSSEADDGIETVKLRVSYGGNFVQVRFRIQTYHAYNHYYRDCCD